MDINNFMSATTSLVKEVPNLVNNTSPMILIPLATALATPVVMYVLSRNSHKPIVYAATSLVASAVAALGLSTFKLLNYIFSNVTLSSVAAGAVTVYALMYITIPMLFIAALLTKGATPRTC